jgi:glycosyltransferase 2 family protein
LEPGAASAIDQAPPWLNRMVALASLAAIGVYLAWLLPRPRVIGRGSWRVRLPSAPLTLVQIGIGVLDLGSAAAAMYALLPAEPHVPFLTLLVIFVLATLLGFASHAPGSLGVFDAALLVAFPQFEKEELIATLLLFRLIYFIIPFALAVTLLGLRELYMNLSAVVAPALPEVLSENVATPPAAPHRHGS